MNNIFTYGTLMDASVRTRVLGKEITGKNDSLSNFRLKKHSVLYSYPVVEKNEGNNVKGMVFEVTDDDLINLDRYESDYYRREIVTLDSGVKSMVYIENDPNLD
jgi:gamma-glutamylcyclotransferase (GGCT)/AIG2-like uncharacterized protein YtfP